MRERQIAGHRAEDRTEHRQRGGTGEVLPRRAGGDIGGGQRPALTPRQLLQSGVQHLEAGARQDALDRYAAEVAPQVLEDRDFLRGARREADVPTLRRHRHGMFAVACEARHAEAGSGPKDGDGSPFESGNLRADNAQVLIGQHFGGIGEYREVIDEHRVLEAECPEIGLRDFPASIGETRGACRHGAGRRDGGHRRHLRSALVEVGSQGIEECGKCALQILASPDIPGKRAGSVDDGEAGVRTSDVAHEDGFSQSNPLARRGSGRAIAGRLPLPRPANLRSQNRAETRDAAIGSRPPAQWRRGGPAFDGMRLRVWGSTALYSRVCVLSRVPRHHFPLGRLRVEGLAVPMRVE